MYKSLRMSISLCCGLFSIPAPLPAPKFSWTWVYPLGFFKLIFINFCFVYLHVCVCVSLCLYVWACVCGYPLSVWACVCRYPPRQEEGLRAPKAGVAGSCEAPDVGDGNQTQDPCKTSPNFYSLVFKSWNNKPVFLFLPNSLQYSSVRKKCFLF